MNKITHNYELEWNGILIEISYSPNYFGDIIANLDIKTIAPEKSKLPITSTGYRSHFLQDTEMQSFDSPVSYVREWLDEAAKSKEWIELQESLNQLSLF